MKTFEELKEELLQRAKDADACQEGYAMGLRSTSRQDLLEAITKNWHWVFKNRVVDAEYLEENFTGEELSEAGIYTRGFHEVRTASFICGSGAVEAYGNATVVAHGRGAVKAYNDATVKAYGRGAVKAYDSGAVEAYDNATVEAYDNATVKAYDDATVEAYNNATVKAYNNATVEAYGNSYVEDCTGKDNIRPQSGHAIVKDYHNHRIYIRKDSLEVIEIE